MEIQQSMHGAVTVIRPNGPVVGDDAEQLKERLLAIRTKSLGRLVLDVSAVPFVDSRGLEIMLDVTEDVQRSGQALKLCGSNSILREVLDLTELATQFEHYEDVNTAVRSFL